MNERALKVLEQYELEVGQLRRGRGSYMFDTPQGLRMLCDCTCSEHKAEFQNRVMERMREGGYQRVDRIVQNREGKLVSEDRDGSRYLVREWYVGRECDTASESEILAAVENLARIHQLMQLPDEPELIESCARSVPLSAGATRRDRLNVYFCNASRLIMRRRRKRLGGWRSAEGMGIIRSAQAAFAMETMTTIMCCCAAMRWRRPIFPNAGMTVRSQICTDSCEKFLRNTTGTSGLACGCWNSTCGHVP